MDNHGFCCIIKSHCIQLYCNLLEILYFMCTHFCYFFSMLFRSRKDDQNPKVSLLIVFCLMVFPTKWNLNTFDIWSNWKCIVVWWCCSEVKWSKCCLFFFFRTPFLHAQLKLLQFKGNRWSIGTMKWILIPAWEKLRLAALLFHRVLLFFYFEILSYMSLWGQALNDSLCDFLYLYNLFLIYKLWC